MTTPEYPLEKYCPSCRRNRWGHDFSANDTTVDGLDPECREHTQRKALGQWKPKRKPQRQSPNPSLGRGWDE